MTGIKLALLSAAVTALPVADAVSNTGAKQAFTLADELASRGPLFVLAVVVIALAIALYQSTRKLWEKQDQRAEDMKSIIQQNANAIAQNNVLLAEVRDALSETAKANTAVANEIRTCGEVRRNLTK